MGLFATLTAPLSQQQSSSSSDSMAPTATTMDKTIPTVVQLYRRSSSSSGNGGGGGGGGGGIRFESSVCNMPSYAVLSYSAVPVSAALSSDPATSMYDANSNCEPPETPLGAASTRGMRYGSKAAMLQALAPELGVWNMGCSIGGTSSTGGSGSSTAAGRRALQDAALLQVPASPSVFCLTIDLSDPYSVESTITSLQETLVRYLISRNDSSNNIASGTVVGGGGMRSETATTTLYALRSNQFGLAPNDEESALKMKGEAPDETDRDVYVTLMVCAKMPPSSSSPGGGADSAAIAEQDEYRQKQIQSLLLYHLRRYASSLNAYLCFVGGASSQRAGGGIGETSGISATGGGGRGPPGDIATSDGAASSTAAPSSRSPDEQPALSTSQLAFVLRELALGKAVDLTLPELKTPGSATTSTVGGDGTSADVLVEAVYPSVYGPHNQQEQEDMIETVLLRNAHYPGQWDASKESIWKILPPHDGDGDASGRGTSKSGASAASTAGDNTWLQELLDSVGVDPSSSSTAGGSGTKTPPRSNKKTPIKAAGDAAGKSAAGSKTPNDVAVSDFFNSLLKS